MNLSYPYRPAKLSILLVIILSIIVPILSIISVCLFTTHHPDRQAESNRTTSQNRIQKLQSLNTSLLGLGVSLATSTVIFTGVKNLTGKPRPHFLSACDPDLENIETYAVGGFGTELSRLWVMVDVEICRQSDKGLLRDAFRSFPSGHATSESFQT
jgi:membrane-associated phospholipid phosphatase